MSSSTQKRFRSAAKSIVKAPRLFASSSNKRAKGRLLRRAAISDFRTLLGMADAAKRRVIAPGFACCGCAARAKAGPRRLPAMCGSRGRLRRASNFSIGELSPSRLIARRATSAATSLMRSRRCSFSIRSSLDVFSIWVRSAVASVTARSRSSRNCEIVSSRCAFSVRRISTVA